MGKKRTCHVHLGALQSLDSMQELVPLGSEDRDQSHALADSNELLKLTIQHRLLLGEETELEEEPIANKGHPDNQFACTEKNPTSKIPKNSIRKTYSSSGSIAPVYVVYLAHASSSFSSLDMSWMS